MSDKATPRIRIALRGHGSYITDELDGSLRHDIEWLIDSGDPKNYLRISIVMMTGEEFEALPSEFEGWGA